MGHSGGMEPETRQHLDVVIHPVIDERSSPNLVRLTSTYADVNVGFETLRATTLARRQPVVLHVNWPEHVVRSNGPLVKSVLKQAEAIVITMLLVLRRHSVVWTGHNLEPHDGWNGPIERALFWAMRRRMTGVVTLVPGHEKAIIDRYPDLADVPFQTIEWGSVAVRSENPPPRPAPGTPVRLLMVGAIGPYKQQLEVMRWIKPFIESGQATLTLAGPVGDPAYLERIRSIAPDQGFEVIDRWVTDPELDDIIRSHHAVIAPQDHAFNTGVPYVALPAGTPVVMSPSRQADWLIESQGSEWVRLLPRADDPVDIADMLAWAAGPRAAASPGPWDWASKAEAHRLVYERATAALGGRDAQGALAG